MQITKKIDDLTLEIWTFKWIGNHIYLDEYSLLHKESKRHRNYTALKKYSRLMGMYNTITESEVPFTDELKAEVLSQFISEINVLKWSERK